jgi:ferredoxin
MAVRRLQIDPTACDGRGVCAELLPELIDLDRWGYPLLREPLVPARLLPLARRAVAACPKAAVRLQEEGRPATPPRGMFF